MAHRTLLTLLAALLLSGGCDDGTEPGPGAPFSLETAYTFTALAADDFVTDFAFAPDGTLWVTTFEGAIIRSADGEESTFHAEAIAGTGATARDLFMDGQGRPWIAAGGVVAVYHAGEWRVEGPPDPMGLAPKAQAVAVNAAGDVLVGMGDVDAGGLLLRRGGSWEALTPAASSLESPLTEAIAVGPDGSFWVAHGIWQGRGGLARIADGAVAARYTTDDGLLYNHIDALAIGDGRIWLGYGGWMFDEAGPDGGIQAVPLDGGAPATWLPHETGRVSSRVRTLVPTSAGELWFATAIDTHATACPGCFAGVGFIDADGAVRVVSYLDADLAPNEFLTRIREGPDGEIYVARAWRKEVARVVR